MKSLLVLHCYLFLIGYSLAANDGNCDITGIDDNDYQTVFTLNINDTQIETNILSTPYTGTLEVQTYTSQDYFIVTTEDGNFVIKTTAGFGNFDEDTAKQSNTFAIVSLDCTFTCSSGTSTLLIQVLVTDINSHAPEFDQDDYVYSVASPMMPLTDFSIYGDKSLTAKDIDFSNQDITFTVTPDDFSISTISTSDSKSYTASFAARNVIQLTGNRTYTITATDSGTNPGPLTTSTTITLTVDESTSLDIPSFESSSYSFNYTVNDTSPKLTELDGPITIVTNKPSDLTEPELTGDYSQYFEAVVNEQTSTIEVSAIDLLPDDVGSFVIVTLSVSTDNRASTSLIVYLAESAESVVQFSSHYYTGSYSDLTNSITLDNPITVTSSSTPAVKLAGEYNEHFSIKYEQSTSSCLITVKSNLTINETQASSYITLTITATVGKYSDTANLLLVLPEYELKFTEPLYEATYNDNTVTIDGNSSIGFTTEIEDVTITIGGNYQEYFGIAYKAATKQWSLIITKSLSNDTLKTEKEIVLILTATDVYKNVAESVVTIQLPKVETNAPEFSESYYLANYSAYINNSTVSLNNNIAVINRDDQSKINITLDSYSENFGIEYDNSLNKWIFKVISPLDEDILLSKNEVIITLLAEEENNSNKGKAVVVINWISEAAPTFSQAYYIGVYPVNGTGVVEVQPDISFTNVGDPSEIKMRLDSYADNFVLTYKSNKWTVTIKSKLDDKILAANEELVVALTAENDNGKEGQSVLIIQLPNAQKAPEFSNIYYTAKYPESGSGIIELDPAISFKNGENPDSITVTLDNYVDNFEVSYGVDGWFVQIKEGLSSTTLSQNTELVITLVATESGVDSTGESVLIMRLPSSGNATNIQFSEAYYIAEYPDTATSSIELESPIEIINVDDITKVKLTLDNYIENFEIIYQSNQWHINIKKELDKNVLFNNAELVMSLIATEVNNTDKGYSALVIKLPTGINGTAPKFSEAYYKGTYPENGTGIIEILNPIGFTNVDDPTKVGIVLDNFSDNFEIVYSSNMWHINIKKPLESSVLTKNVDLVITMVATKTGYTAQGESALVLTLPGATIGPKFAATYYIAKYPKNSTGIIEFDAPISFLNIDDPTTLTLTLDNYSSNFEIKYASKRWYINITEGLEDKILKNNSELVVTLIATETASGNEGYSALVLELPSTDNNTSPEFSSTYYLADYPKDGKGFLELEDPIQCLNEDLPEQISITLDSYPDNFEVVYDQDTWKINIKKSIDQDILNKNNELVMTLIATESGYESKGYSALVIKLPSEKDGTSIEFTEAYYLAKYPEDGNGTIELENPISFLNVEDPETVTISLDKYSENFQILYTSNKWVINIMKNINESILNKNAELLMTLTATDSADNTVDYSALVLELPTGSNESGPIFSDAYYIAEYTEDANDIIEFDNAIGFENVDDPSKISIQLDNYTSYFDILLSSGKWYIQIVTPLDESVLKENPELIATLIATDDENKQGYAALVLKLPIVNEVAPEFSDAYYKADYIVTDNKGNVAFTYAINITNKDDLSKIKISVDNYQENFSLTYDSGKNTWVMNVLKQISDDILISKTDIVIGLTATDTTNNLTSHTVVDLTLPAIDNLSAPKFSKTYYTARYSFNGDTPVVTLDTPLNITNRKDVTDISISMDNYVGNFKVEYVATNKEWGVTVTQNLDESILNARLDLVMMLTATDKTTNETGQCALIITLPIVNNKEAPKFSRIYYSGEYESGDNVSVSLDNAIEIVNKEDLTKVEIGFDDSYKDNFEIYYQADSSSWKLDVKSPLAEQILNTENEIILTLTATETNNTSIGEAVLILELPLGESKLPPRFNLPHYSAEYVIEDSKAIILLSDTITIINKKDLATITVTLDTYDTNFDIKYDPYNETWTLSVIDILSEDILKSTSELVLTLIATENDNENTGQSTLILTLPASQDNSTSEVISFSQVHYSANYSVVGNTGAIQMSDVISVKREESISDVSVTFENESYSSYFEIIQDSDNYAVSVVTELPQTVLNDFVSLPLSLVATAGDNQAYATLVIDLPVAANISAVEFSQPLYEGTYTVVDGTASFEVSDTIQVETDEEDVNIEYSVSSSTGYEEYFELSYAAKVLTVTKQNDLPEEVLRSISVIPLILTVGISGTTYTSSAVLNVKVDFSDDEPSSLIEFSSVLFSGKYEAHNGFGFLTVDEPVTVNTTEADSNVEVTISNEYHDYFTATYSSKIVSVLLSKPLSTGILNSSTFIPISLEASIIDTSYKSSAVLNIRIIYDSEDDPGTIEFSTVLYTADYSVDDGKGHLTVNQNIALITDASDDQIETSIADGSEFKNYFQTSYSSKSITVELTKEIPEDILTNTSIIPLTLTAEITGTTHRTSAVLNIDVHVSDELEDTSIIFSNVLYDGKYQVSDGIGVLTVSDQISVVTNASDDIIKVIVSNEFDGYFTASYSNKIVTITLVRQLSTELLNSSTFIPITLQASVTGSEHQASAVLNIKIKYDSNDDDTDNYIEFSSILYNSVYLVSNGKGELVSDDIIRVITDKDEEEILVGLSEDSEYSDYFTILYSSNIVTVAVTQNLSPVILEENTFIALTLNVGIKDTTQESSAVLNIKLPDDDDTYISFSSVLYNGTYTVTDGTGVLTIKNQIEVLTNVDNDNVKVEITNEYSDYFRVTYLDKIVTISLIQQLPTTVLNSSSVIPILLQVSIVGGSYLDSSVLNIDIRYDSDNDPGTIEFAAVLYTAEYAIEDEKGTLKLNKDIKVITDSSDDKIEASLSDDAGYISYFSISYSNHIVSIKIREDLPQKALADNSFIVLTITVGIKGTTHRSSAVLNIKIDDDDTDNKSCEVLSMKTAYIAVICVLSILLLALITAAIAFYYLRLRSKNYANLEEEDGRVRFNKNTLQRSSSDIKPPSTLDERRPTGFIFNPINDDLDGTDSINDTEKSRRKSVAFDDNVEKLQIEPTEDNVSDDDNNNVDNSENFDDKSDNISDKSDNEVDNSDHKIDHEVTNV